MVAAMVAGPEEEMKSSRKYQSHRPWFYLLQLFHADPRQRLKLAG
jgi:hypothetical protein